MALTNWIIWQHCVRIIIGRCMWLVIQTTYKDGNLVNLLRNSVVTFVSGRLNQCFFRSTPKCLQSANTGSKKLMLKEIGLSTIRALCLGNMRSFESSWFFVFHGGSFSSTIAYRLQAFSVDMRHESFC